MPQVLLPAELFVRAALDFCHHKQYRAALWHLELDSGLQHRSLPAALERLRGSCAAGNFTAARKQVQENAAALREIARAEFLEGLYMGKSPEQLWTQFRTLRLMQDPLLTQQLLRAMGTEPPPNWTPLHGRLELFEQLLGVLTPELSASNGAFAGLFEQLMPRPPAKFIVAATGAEPVSSFLDSPRRKPDARSFLPPRLSSAKKRKFDLFMGSQRKKEGAKKSAPEAKRPTHRPSKSSTTLPRGAEGQEHGAAAVTAHKRACSSGIARRPVIEDFFLNDSTTSFDREATEYYPVGPFAELCTVSDIRTPRAAAFSPDGERLAVASRAGQLAFFNLQAALEGRGRAPEASAMLSLPGGDLVGPLAWSPSSQLLAVCAADKAVVVAGTDPLLRVG